MALVFLSRALSSAGDSLYCSQETTQQVRELLLWLWVAAWCPSSLPALTFSQRLLSVGCQRLASVLGWFTLVEKSEWIPLGKREFLSDLAAECTDEELP